jgi:hypothetical protein
MGPDDRQTETLAQWMEHTDAWRYAHLDLAPSDLLRRETLATHDRLEQTVRAATLQAVDEPILWQAWLRLPLLTRQIVLLAMLAMLVVAVVAVGAFLA